MKRLFPLVLGALLALSSVAGAAVRVGIKEGKLFLYNDGASSAPRESIHESDTWLAWKGNGNYARLGPLATGRAKTLAEGTARAGDDTGNEAG